MTKKTANVKFSSTSDESDYDYVDNDTPKKGRSNLNKLKNDYSYDYEYSYSSDDNLPQIRPIQQRSKIPSSGTRSIQKNATLVKKPIRPIIRSRPQPLPSQNKSSAGQNSASIIQDENNSDDENINFLDQPSPKSKDIENYAQTKLSNVQDVSNDNKLEEIDNIKVNEKAISDESLSYDDTINTTTNLANENNDQNINYPDRIDVDNNIDEKKDDINAKYYASYFCSRTPKLDMKSPYHFTLGKRDEIFFYAKTKGLFSSHVYISSNENLNIKEKRYDYVLKITKNRSHFTLRKANDKTDLLIMIFDNDYGKEYGPRKISMEWPQTNLKFLSRIPRKTESGNWELNFNGKYVLSSQKNAIILNENSKPTIMIRKIKKQILQIEVIQNLELIYIFAVGVASFICPF